MRQARGVVAESQRLPRGVDHPGQVPVRVVLVARQGHGGRAVPPGQDEASHAPVRYRHPDAVTAGVAYADRLTGRVVAEGDLMPGPVAQRDERQLALVPGPGLVTSPVLEAPRQAALRVGDRVRAVRVPLQRPRRPGLRQHRRETGLRGMRPDQHASVGERADHPFGGDQQPLIEA